MHSAYDYTTKFFCTLVIKEHYGDGALLFTGRSNVETGHYTQHNDKQHTGTEEKQWVVKMK